jgi:hypothetical protein
VPVFNEIDNNNIAPIYKETTDTTSRHYIPTVEDTINELESDDLPKDISLKDSSPKQVLPIAISPTDKTLPRETQEPLRYFTRAEKRKRTNLSIAKTEQYLKVVKAILAQMELSTKELEIFECIFPATEINGVIIPQIY